MFFVKLLVLVLLSFNLYAQNTYMNSISFEKIKKLVEKEEQIAVAYKQYILANANAPTSMNDLSLYLPKGFSKINPFGREMKLSTEKIEDELPSNIKVISNISDYYYSNENRKYTKAPFSSNNNKVGIDLTSKEKYILEFKDLITLDKSLALNKYHLDTNGVLHWYDASGIYKFSIDKDLIIGSSVTMFDENGDITPEFINLFDGKKVLYAGQTVFYLQNNLANEYINLGEMGGFVRVSGQKKDIGKTILQFTRRSGGIIVNGDIYTWGNNANKIAGFNNNSYKNIDGNNGTGNPIITTLLRAKAKTYNSAIDDKKYFSSPLRPKFIDFSSDVWHSTCGITTKGELYCGGKDALLNNYIDFEGYDRTIQDDTEVLHRSLFFDGINQKAKKIFPLENTWLVLANTSIDENGNDYNGELYYWGKDHQKGWSGTGSRDITNVRIPTKILIENNNAEVKIRDLTFALTIGFRRVAVLSDEGDVYTWGLDTQSTETTNTCTQTIESVEVNLCEPLKVNSNIKFVSILGGQQTFVTKDEQGNFYRISQPNGYFPKVDKINDLIKVYPDYIENDDIDILSVDISSKLIAGVINEYDSYGQGIVWVNSKNQLKGDYFTGENKDDALFNAAINKIKWKKIRVVEDKNGMCGIDIYNQMYCWGAMSFYAGDNAAGNTFMLPIFNANLHDLDKDYLLAAGGKADGKISNVSNMTSGDWSRGTNGEYFMKYPTYIGGFNYEFTFK